MTTFYYDKDRYGNEHCHEVDDVQKDAAERLYQIGDDAACAVTIIREDDVMGYSSIEEYIKGECPETPTAEFQAMAEYLDGGGSYPFALVRHQGGEYEAMAEKDVDYVELSDEYEDFCHWIKFPCYYSTDEFTAPEADKLGMYALADAIRQITKPYKTRDREAGNLIDEFATLEEAQDAVEQYEADDEADGTYTPNFYEIYNAETEQIESL